MLGPQQTDIKDPGGWECLVHISTSSERELWGTPQVQVSCSCSFSLFLSSSYHEYRESGWQSWLPCSDWASGTWVCFGSSVACHLLGMDFVLVWVLCTSGVYFKCFKAWIGHRTWLVLASDLDLITQQLPGDRSRQVLPPSLSPHVSGCRKQPAPGRLLPGGPGGGLVNTGFSPGKPLGAVTVLLLPGPAWAMCNPGILRHVGLWASMGGEQLDTGPGAPSHFRRRVFRPNPGHRIKGHLSVPRCPALAFPNNIPLCRLPRLLQPPPRCTQPPFTASAVGLFVCHAEGRLFLFSFLSPSCTIQAHPLWGRSGALERGLGAQGRGLEHPSEFSQRG